MCLFVWVGSARALTSVRAPPADAPDSLLGYHVVEHVPADAPIARHFAARAISYVGSHEGSGCGYNTDSYRFGGFDETADSNDDGRRRWRRPSVGSSLSRTASAHAAL